MLVRAEFLIASAVAIFNFNSTDLLAKQNSKKQSETACSAKVFSYSRSQGDRELKLLFDSLDRNLLQSYLFFELSNPRKQSIALPLLKYLYGSEQNIDRRNFYDLLAHTSDIKLDNVEKDNRPLPIKLDLKEICEIEGKIK